MGLELPAEAVVRQVLIIYLQWGRILFNVFVVVVNTTLRVTLRN
jgi:hypothetical protein